ncbi:MAG: molybdopterin-binding protein [Ilumatobacteraceae bacterium]
MLAIDAGEVATTLGPPVIKVIGVLIGIKIGHRLIRRVATKAPPKFQRQAGYVLPKVVTVFGVLILLGSLGININSLLAMMATIGLGAALVFTPIGQNLIAGFLAGIDDVVREGDVLSVGDKVGRVVRKGSLSLGVLMPDGSTVYMPNVKAVDDELTNHSRSRGPDRGRDQARHVPGSGRGGGDHDRNARAAALADAGQADRSAVHRDRGQRVPLHVSGVDREQARRSATAFDDAHGASSTTSSTPDSRSARHRSWPRTTSEPARSPIRPTSRRRRSADAATVEWMTDRPLLAKVLTVSDGVVHRTREDRSGAALADCLTRHGFEVVDRQVTADGTDNVAAALRQLTDGFAGLVVSTGGTGFARDQTPEGTRLVVEREAPGLAEAMRLISPLGRLLSRDRRDPGRAIICNTPGSPKGCVEQLEAIIDVLPHALALLADTPTSH